MSGSGIADAHQIEEGLNLAVLSVLSVKSQKYHITQFTEFQDIWAQKTSVIRTERFYMGDIRGILCNGTNRSRPVAIICEQMI